MRTRTKAAEWAKRVRGWQASGEAATSYAAARGWNAHTFRWWARQLRRGGAGATVPSVQFVQVSPRAAAPSPLLVEAGLPWAIEVHHASGHKVRVSAGVDGELLRTVLGALEPR